MISRFARSESGVPDAAGPTRCELCGRATLRITEHHLVPRGRGGHESEKIDLCAACHEQVHRLFTNRELAAGLSTVEALRERPEVRSFLAWVRRQDPEKRIRVLARRTRRR